LTLVLGPRFIRASHGAWQVLMAARASSHFCGVRIVKLLVKSEAWKLCEAISDEAADRAGGYWSRWGLGLQPWLGLQNNVEVLRRPDPPLVTAS
jgi:hypothetical protein